MSTVDDYIRAKIREAREEAKLTQAEVGARYGGTQVTISDLERGRTRPSAADLLRLATILGKPVLFFLPVSEEQDLEGDELQLLVMYREFDAKWRQSILSQIETQLTLYRMTRDSDVAAEGISALPKDQRADAAYAQVASWLKPLVDKGLRIIVENGRVYMGHKNLKKLKIPYPLEDDDELEYVLEMQRRLTADSGDNADAS